MKINTSWDVRRAAAVASVSLLLAAPAFASAALFDPPLGTSILNHVIQQLCEIQQARGNRVRLVDPARCLPPPPAPPMLTVTKVVVNDNGGTATVNDFAFFIDGATTTSGVAVPVSAGVHTVTENPSANYFATFGGDCNANGTVTLSAGESKECIITNNDVAPPLPGTLIVDKVTEPSGSTRVFDVMVTGTGAITGGGAGTTTDAVSKNYEVEAGTYSVTETVPDGWVQVSNTCTNVAVSAGETETCTITNRKEPTITVTKVVVNDNGGTATSSDFMIHVHDMSGTTTVDVAGSPQAGSATGTSYTVAPGPYHVAETGGPEGYLMTVGGDCAADGSITLAAGDNKTCTVTNNDNPPSAPMLTVTKVVINDNGGTAVTSDFALFVDSMAVTSGSATTTTVGAHVVSETASSSYSAVISGDCDASGNVTLAVGQSKTCTITNNDVAPAVGSITVIKTVVNDNGGTATSSDFTLHLHMMPGSIDVSGSPQAGNTTGTTYSDLAAGSYHVEENATSAYSTTFSGDCDSTGNITLGAGESKTCTVTNNDNPVEVTGKLLITEVLYDLPNDESKGVENQNEWVEIYNGMNVAVDLSGYTLNDALSTSTIPNDTMLPSGKYLVVTGSATTAGFWSIPGDAVVVVVSNGEIGNGLNNDGDHVFLRNSAGADIDAVSWGDHTDAFDPPVADAPAGYSITRTSPTTDTDTAADWTQTAAPTPGS